MNQPDLFEVGFSVNPRSPKLTPHPLANGKVRLIARCKAKDCKFCKAFDEDPNTGPFLRIVNNEKCPDHPRRMLDVHQVHGTLNESTKCDPRCTSAIGPNCSCSCGGANHGCGWL